MLKSKTVAACLFSLLILISCSESQNENSSIQEEKPNEAIIIISNPKVESKIEFKGIYMTSPTFIELGCNGYIDRRVEIKENVSDTIVLPVENEFSELYHVHNAFNDFKYYVKKGDTLRINYRDSVPIAYLNSNRKLNFNTHFDFLIKQEMYGENIKPEVMLRSPFPFMNRSKNLAKEQKRVIEEASNRMQHGFGKEAKILDSLRTNNLITTDDYQHRILNLEFSKLNHYLMYDTSKLNLNFTNNYIAKAPVFYQKYKSFRDLLENYLTYKYKKEIPLIAGKNGFNRDERLLFEAIQKDSILTNLQKEYLLFTALEKVIKNYTIDDIEKYSALFQDFSQNKEVVSYLKDKYNIGYKASDLVLEDKNGKEFSLSTLIKEKNSTLYYLDFWASWCKPCIAVIPDSKDLKTQYKEEDITFIYLSIDEDKEKWLKADRKYALGNNSYLIKNRYSSEFLEKIKLEAIPRYLLLNKEGEIIQVNAPDPSSEELKRIIGERI